MRCECSTAASTSKGVLPATFSIARALGRVDVSPPQGLPDIVSGSLNSIIGSGGPHTLIPRRAAIFDYATKYASDDQGAPVPELSRKQDKSKKVD